MLFYSQASAYHIIGRHKRELASQFLKIDEMVEKRRKESVENIAELRRKKDSTFQPKLVSKNGQIGLDVKRDLELQKRWDAAVVDFCSQTFCSFNAASKVDILLKALWPNGKFKVQLKDPRTIARHVMLKANEVREQVYSIISCITGSEGGAAFTTDIWTSRKQDSFMCLTTHNIDQNWDLVMFCPFVRYMDGDRHTAEKSLRLKRM